jgi:hypothetical protein
MCGEHRAQSFRADQRGIPRQDNRKFRGTQRAARYLHGVTGAVLRLLQHTFCVERLDYCGDLVGLMAYHRYGSPRFQWNAGGKNVFDQRSSSGAMQNFCHAGLQARAFSRSENHDSKIFCRHKSNHSAGAESISQMR